MSQTLAAARIRRLLRALLPVAAACSAATAAAQIVIFPPIRLPTPKPDDLVAISSGAKHNCASRRDGMVLCWGNNDQGQSGVGTQRSDWCTSFYCVITPTRVATDINGAAFASTRVSAGQNHSCALDAAGAVFCWGYNFNGQTGVPSLGQVWQPTAAASGKRFTAISAGNRTTCAVEPGATWCWGLINDGGPGSFSLNGDQSTGVVRSSWAPLAIQPSSANYQAVSVGNMHACMQTNVWGFTEINCIGRNDFGELGYDPSLGHAFVIFGSGFGRPVGAPQTSANFTCVDRHSDGTVACAGNNTLGNLGDGSFSHSGTPRVVGGNKKLAGVAVGWGHACALDPNQNAWCWGLNDSGQLGNGNRVSSPLPVQVRGTVKFRALSAGERHTCGIGTDNNLYCWGANGEGQLGRGYVGSYDWEPRRPLGPFRL